ncbi:formylglycine-generating enzyme family protein [Minwuia sp.]|uniref:formylglycine-generating enzyme family protein n=1 Tax=Minwuia sp. TaxID=2493630 RepID=UPI003A8E075C
MIRSLSTVIVCAAGIGMSVPDVSARTNVSPPETVEIPAGSAIIGSDRAEREAAYVMDAAAYGHQTTRDQGWYESEADRQAVRTDVYSITRHPITNAQYASFVEATDHPVPDVRRATWKGYGLIHPYERTQRHAWRGHRPPAGREEHPVVLVSLGDARAYAAWLSGETGDHWRLPTEIEWERAARGDSGARFPWGDSFEPTRLNSHDAGPFDTLPVGSFPAGQSAHGLMDAAGQVFEWTSTEQRPGRHIVKGGSWDDSGCGVCRPAARHGRPDTIKHILIGFRLVREVRK